MVSTTAQKEFDAISLAFVYCAFATGTATLFGCLMNDEFSDLEVDF